MLVVGSGPGGLAAAIGAARAGASTMLVERFGCLGGNITVVGVESLAWYRREQTVDSEGIGIELEQRAKAMGATSPEVQSNSEAINADMFKYVADLLVAEAGVTPLLHAVAIDVVDGRRHPRGRHRPQQVGARRDPGQAHRRRLRRRRRRPLRRRAVPQDAEGDDVARDGDVFGRRRRQAALPRLRRGEPQEVQGLGPQLGHAERRQGRRAVQPVPVRAVRSRARDRRHPAGPEEHRRHVERDQRRRRGDVPQHDPPDRVRRHRRLGPDQGGDRRPLPGAAGRSRP